MCLYVGLYIQKIQKIDQIKYMDQDGQLATRLLYCIHSIHINLPRISRTINIFKCRAWHVDVGLLEYVRVDYDVPDYSRRKEKRVRVERQGGANQCSE